MVSLTLRVVDSTLEEPYPRKSPFRIELSWRVRTQIWVNLICKSMVLEL